MAVAFGNGFSGFCGERSAGNLLVQQHCTVPLPRMRSPGRESPMNKAFVLSVALVALASPAAGFDLKDAAYFCTTEMSAGLAYDRERGRWSSAIFRPAAPLMLRLRILGTRVEKDVFGSSETVADFDVSITKQGSNFESPCTHKSMPSIKAVSVHTAGLVRCNSSLVDYVFNLNNNRFLEIFDVGYVNGDDGESETPAVSGGLCTKISE
jgi:hypothetical protein